MCTGVIVQVDKAPDLESSIKRDVEKAVRDRCDCDFSSSTAIYSGEFSCRFSMGNSVMYRAKINGTSDVLNVWEILEYIQDWRVFDESLLYNKIRLSVDTKIKLTIESLTEKECDKKDCDSKNDK